MPNSLFAAASWLLLLGAMAALAATGYQVYERHIADKPSQQFNFAAQPASNKSEQMDLSKIVQKHIFGIVPVKKAEKPKVVEAPKTNLKLTLTGVITEAPAGMGRAMIEVKRGTTSIVRVGEKIGKTGAKLDAVFSDHILIDRQGKIEKLLIDRATLEISDLSTQNSKTISALNINVSEFEALAKVDPADLAIEKLLPKQPAATKSPDLVSNQTSISTAQSEAEMMQIQLNLEVLESINKMEELGRQEQQLRELESQQEAADNAAQSQ